MKLAYFVHDLTDPAVARRVRMLAAGGAEPVVLGFRREDRPPATVAGAPAVDLGRTYDGRLAQRAAMTARRALGAAAFREHLAGARVIVARTLEMLAVAEAARRLTGSRARLVYECLDIHRLMLGEGAKSRAMRAIERTLMRRSDLLVVSSPAFLTHYFQPRQGVGGALRLETLLVENKVLELDAKPPRAPASRAPGPPWRIGWMGAIRCRRSLDILTGLAARRPDLIEVAIHGRPAYREFADFDGQVAAVPNVGFFGPYSADQLPGLYAGVHFAWAIDFMEEGLNSAWLLPNRLYEASRHGAIPIALKSVQTGRYLEEAGFGLRLDAPQDLEAALEAMTPELYAGLKAELAALPGNAFASDREDCRRLVEALAGGRPQAAARGPEQASQKLTSKAFAVPEHYQGEAV